MAVSVLGRVVCAKVVGGAVFLYTDDTGVALVGASGRFVTEGRAFSALVSRAGCEENTALVDRSKTLHSFLC